MKHDVKTIFNTTKRKVLKRSPEILTGLGVAGMITTVVLSVKATPKAMKLIEEEKINRQAERETVDDQDSIELTKLEVVKNNVIKSCNSNILCDYDEIEPGSTQISFDGDISKVVILPNFRWL